MGGDRRGDDHGVEGLVRKQLLESLCTSGLRIAAGKRRQAFAVGVAKERERAGLVEVPRQVRAPVAEPDDADSRHSFQTFGLLRPAVPVALRKSTTTFASRTTWSWLIVECAVRIATQSYAAGWSAT